MFKKIIALGVLLIMIFPVYGLTGCGGKDYTESEHVERISDLIEKNFFDEKAKYKDIYTSYTTEILYTLNDEPIYFLVEFEPYGFIYGFIHKNKYYATNFCGNWPAGCKRPINGAGAASEWTFSPYVEGYQNRSHFHVAGIKDEKKYLILHFQNWATPVIKRDDKFIHVITNEEINIDEVNISYIPTWVSRNLTHYIWKL